MRYTKYIAILLVLFAVSCTTDDFEQPVNNSNHVQIVSRIKPFTDRDVNSRANKTEEKEYKVNTMDLIIFGNDLKCVYMAQRDGELVTSIDRGTPLADGSVNGGDFQGIDQDNLSECQIYAIANFPELRTAGLGIGNTIQDFMDLFTSVSGIDVPATGMPMLGSYINADTGNKVDLRASDTQVTTPYEVHMEALYAKIVFDINVSSTQSISGITPQFMIEGFKVHNVVEKVDFYSGNESPEGTITGEDDKTPLIMDGEESKVFDGIITGKTIATDRGEHITFSFYLPERYLRAATAANAYNYPFGTGTNIRTEDLNLRQRYKPLLAKENATYVTFTGIYTDHQGHTFDVSYDIYVGNDNYGNFDIKRNCQYNNTVTIKGIQNSSDQSTVAGAVSIDHRVNVERTLPIIISLRRETMLDAHFEIRPLRIRANANHVGDETVENVTVQVLNVDGTATNIPNWIRLERSFGVGSDAEGQDLFCTAEGSSKGKRKYFTYGLVSGKQLDGSDEPYCISGNTNLSVPVNSNGECVWIYVDECTEASTNINAIRSAMIRVSYGNKNIDYIINQHKLFAVKTTRKEWETGASFDKEYTYYIEHEEEYLHNFDSDDTFTDNKTEYEGMAWGLENIQLSNLNPAIHVTAEPKGLLATVLEWLGWASTEDMVNDALADSEWDPKYDFYLSRDNVPKELTIRDFSGYDFNKDISTYLRSNYSTNVNAIIDGQGIELNQNPKSAFAYCYNRNKRKYGTGEVITNTNNAWDTSHLEWYIPAIDEIEDIMETAHASFEDFHGKLYWSCQPAYEKYNFDFEYWSRNSEFRDYTNNNDPIKGQYYLDDLSRARATKAEYENGDFKEVLSSGADAKGTQGGQIKITTIKLLGTPEGDGYYPGAFTANTDLNYDDHPGNKLRTDKARVRCVRNTATMETTN